MSTDDLTVAGKEGLELAYRLVDAGIPVLVCRPRPGAKPGDGNDVVPAMGWRNITDAEQTREGLAKFRPGTDTLALIGGHGIDVVDVDTKAGGSVDNLPPFPFYGVTLTPSGGRHYVVPSCGLAKITPLTTEDGPVGDYVGGTEDHQGRLLAYLPGSVRPKYPAIPYVEDVPWNIPAVIAAPVDPDLMLSLLDAGGHSETAPAKFIDEGPERDTDDGVHPYAERSIRAELAGLDEAASEPWAPGAGWDDLTFKAACNLQEFANSRWSGYPMDRAKEDFLAHAPHDASWGTSALMGKWDSAEKTVDGGGRPYPGDSGPAGALADFTPVRDLDADQYDETSLADAHLGERIGRNYLRGRYLAWGKNRWARWDGRKWDLWASETSVLETVRQAMIDVSLLETARAHREHDKAAREAGADQNARANADKRLTTQLKMISGLLNAAKISATVRLARGTVEVSMDDFDGVQTHPLLNVANGVVDLRTGELRPHDPALLFTQVSATPYVAGARHDDWTKALTCLPDEVATWMQTRFGQAATGKATADDVVPFLRGGGANGKTTLLLGVKTALGEFAKPVPEKVITAGPNDHPTELFSLKGVRLAFIEELPEGDYLNVARLKRVTGTESGMSARPIGQDNVEWMPTHSLMVTTNYDVQISEVDHGTWRRLALVDFPHTYDGSDPARPKDDTLRDRIRDGETGQHEAALAWIVEGARRFYASGLQRDRDTPESVREANDAWMMRANPAARFMSEMLVEDGLHAVRSADVYALFRVWYLDQGYRPLSDKTFWSRAEEHPMFKARGVARKVSRSGGWATHVRFGAKPPTGAERLVLGVKFTENSVEILETKCPL